MRCSPYLVPQVMIDLALDAVSTVAMEDGGRKEIDIKRYAKIEKIPGGDVEDCRVLKGVMINKDVVHGKMRRRIEKPRILLLDCTLEYKKGESQTSIELTDEKVRRHASPHSSSPLPFSQLSCLLSFLVLYPCAILCPVSFCCPFLSPAPSTSSPSLSHTIGVGAAARSRGGGDQRDVCGNHRLQARLGYH